MLAKPNYNNNASNAAEETTNGSMWRNKVMIMKTINFRMALAGSFLLATMGFAANSQAALVDCPVDFTTDSTAKVHDGSTGKNTAADLCQYDDDISEPFGTNDTSTVNALGFFNEEDWQSAGKQNIGGIFESGDFDIGFTITGDGQSGTWSIASNSFTLFDDIMFVFKDGADTNLVGFHLDNVKEIISGGWDTPFVDPPFSSVGDPKDVSNIAAYVRSNGNGDDGPPAQIPEPGNLALLGIGLLGMGLARRRRRLR